MSSEIERKIVLLHTELQPCIKYLTKSKKNQAKLDKTKMI